MTINIDDDPVMVIRAIGELTISLYAMHMSQEALQGAAQHLRGLAATQESHEALGVAVHPANRQHDPAMLRMLSAFYEAAQNEAAVRLSGQTIPAPGHFHTWRDGIAEPSKAS